MESPSNEDGGVAYASTLMKDKAYLILLYK